MLTLLNSVQRVLGPTPAPYQTATDASFPEVNRPNRERDHSPQSTVKIKNMWKYSSIRFSPYALKALGLINESDKFTPIINTFICTRVVPKVISNFFSACELGTADEGECGGRWNQMLCYP